MATKKDTKKKKDLTITNPYAFFTRGRSKKAIQMDYLMKAKPPSSKEKRVNRTDYPGENFYYLEYFKKHNMPIPKKSDSFWYTTSTASSSGTTTKKTTKKTTAKKTTAKKTASKKKNEIKVTNKTSNSKKEILNKLKPIRIVSNPIDPYYDKITHNNNLLETYIYVFKDKPNYFASQYLVLFDRTEEEVNKWLSVFRKGYDYRFTTFEKEKKYINQFLNYKKLFPVNFIKLIKLEKEDFSIAHFLKDYEHTNKYIAIVEINNKKYLANPYLLKWLIKENYDIYATEKLITDKFSDENYLKGTDFYVILKRQNKIAGICTTLILDRKELTYKYREQNNDIKVTNKTSNSKKEILDKLSSIRKYQSPLKSIHYSKDDTVIKVTDNPDCFAHPRIILLDRNKNEIDKWLEKYNNRREIQYETVVKALKDNSKSEQLLPIKFIELVELDEEEQDTFAYLKTKYIAIVEIDNKKYVANPYLLKWLIKENYDIYAKKEILQDNFDTDYNFAHLTDFIVILKKNEEVKGIVSGLIYKDEDLTNIYREKNKIETSETTKKKVSKKTSTKKSTAKISNPKDYPTLMAMRVKEKIIKDYNRCDFTKEEIEEAVDLAIRRGNETQGQIVKDAINILFATSK